MATTYQIRYRLKGTTAWIPYGKPTTDLSMNMVGLRPLTTYELEVVATDENGAVTSSITEFTTASNAPSVPGTPVPGNITSNSIVVNWSPSGSGTGILYQPMYRVHGAGNLVPFGPPLAGSSVTFTGLQPFTDYDIMVVATNDAGSASSQTVIVRTLAVGVAPAPPTGLAVSNVAQNSLTLSWVSSVSGTVPINYQPMYRLHGATVWTNYGLVTVGNSVAFTGLTSGGNYDFTVSAINSVDTTQAATVINQVLLAAPVAPSAPGTPIATNITGAGAILSWTASTIGTAPVNYQVQTRPTGSGQAFANFGAPIAALTVNLTGLAAGTSYDVQVVANNAANAPAISGILVLQTVASAIPPDAVTGLQVTNVTQNGFTFSWNLSVNGTPPITYQPQRRPTVGGAFTPIGLPISGNSVAVTGLVANTTYDLRVIATNSVSAGVPSAIFQATTAAIVSSQVESVTGTTVTDAVGIIYASRTPGVAQSAPPYDLWTLVLSATVGFQIARNGVVDVNTNDVSQLYYFNHVIYQEAGPNNDWWSWDGTNWNIGPAPISQVESLEGTSLTGAGSSITASRQMGVSGTSPFDIWALDSAGNVILNGAITAVSGTAVSDQLYYHFHQIFVHIPAGWRSWNTTTATWTVTTDPHIGFSQDGASITDTTGVLYDNSSPVSAWTLVAGTPNFAIARNGVVDSVTHGVVTLLWFGGHIHQQTTANEWWVATVTGLTTQTWALESIDPRLVGQIAVTDIQLSGSTVQTGKPSGTVVGDIIVLMSSGAFTGTTSLSGTGASGFRIVNGQLVTNGSIPVGNYPITIIALLVGVSFAKNFTIISSSVVTPPANVPAIAAAVGYNLLTAGPDPRTGWFTVDGTAVQQPDGSMRCISTSGYNGGYVTAVLTGGYMGFKGTAFGGGAYFRFTAKWSGGGAGGNGWPALWMNDIEGQTGYALSGVPIQYPGRPNGANLWYEPDVMEDQNTNAGDYGSSFWHWWRSAGAGSSISGDQAAEPRKTFPGGFNDRTNYHTYGMLWVPAKPGVRGYVAYCFDDVEYQRVEWDYRADRNTLPFPPSHVQSGNVSLSNVGSDFDWRHMYMEVGSGTTSPIDLLKFECFQASAVNNIVIGGGSAPPTTGPGSGPAFRTLSSFQDMHNGQKCSTGVSLLTNDVVPTGMNYVQIKPYVVNGVWRGGATGNYFGPNSAAFIDNGIYLYSPEVPPIYSAAGCPTVDTAINPIAGIRIPIGWWTAGNIISPIKWGLYYEPGMDSGAGEVYAVINDYKASRGDTFHVTANMAGRGVCRSTSWGSILDFTGEASGIPGFGLGWIAFNGYNMTMDQIIADW